MKIKLNVAFVITLNPQFGRVIYSALLLLLLLFLDQSKSVVLIPKSFSKQIIIFLLTYARSD